VLKIKSCLLNIISSIFHNLIHMAGILQMTVFLKSRPFSKCHPFHIGISNISTGFAKNSRLQNSSHLALILKKDPPFPSPPTLLQFRVRLLFFAFLNFITKNITRCAVWYEIFRNSFCSLKASQMSREMVVPPQIPAASIKSIERPWRHRPPSARPFRQGWMKHLTHQQVGEGRVILRI